MVCDKYNKQPLNAKLVLYVPIRLFNMSSQPPPSAVKQNFQSKALGEIGLSNANPGDINKLSGAEVLEALIQWQVLRENPGKSCESTTWLHFV